MEQEVVVYIAVRNYSIQCELTLLLDVGIEASACAHNSTMSTSTSDGCLKACSCSSLLLLDLIRFFSQ